MLDSRHRTFLSTFFKAGDHYSFEEHPIAYLKNKENISSDDLDSALSHRNNTVRVIAADNKNATKEHIDKALLDDEPDVVITAASNLNATKEHIDKAMTHPNWYVRARVARAPNINKEQLNRLAVDSDSVVVESAKSNPMFYK